MNIGSAAKPARSKVLRLRGLPFQATECDIQDFFKTFLLKRIHICIKEGRSTGEAYVELENEFEAKKAMDSLSCKYMGKRYIEIFEASETDMNLDWKNSGSRLGYVLRLRGLPYTATKKDIEIFFEGDRICEGDDSIVFSISATGKPTGEAYVEFVTESDQHNAMRKHMHFLGPRYIELFKSTKADLLQALQQNQFYRLEMNKRQWVIPNISAHSISDHHRNLQTSSLSSQNISYINNINDVLDSLPVNNQSFYHGRLSPAALAQQDAMLMQHCYMIQLQQRQQVANAAQTTSMSHQSLQSKHQGAWIYPSSENRNNSLTSTSPINLNGEFEDDKISIRNRLMLLEDPFKNMSLNHHTNILQQQDALGYGHRSQNLFYNN